LNYFIIYSLQIKAETWTKDTYELIDYDFKNLLNSNLDINNSGYLYRCNNKIAFNEYFSENTNNLELLLQITKDVNSIYEFKMNDCKLDQNKNIESRNNGWFLFKKSKTEQTNDKYKLNEGDIIKLGRITIRIKEIKKNKSLSLNKSIDFSKTNINKIFEKNNDEQIMTKNTFQKNMLTFSTDINKNSYITLKNNRKQIPKLNVNKSIPINVSKTQKTLKHKMPKICRICYCEEDPVNESDNPLVQPCLCSGSLKYIHLNCLKHWLNTKSCTKVETNINYSIFLVRQVECEICKSKFPDFIKYKNIFYEILDFKSEFENYFTVESLTIDKNNTRCIYVINLDNNIKLKVGRGHDANLILTDISVSRVHCLITINNKSIYLEDNNSKFGTLVLVQNPTLQLIENLPLNIQIGRTFLNCIVQRSSSIFSCCGVNEKLNNNFYYEQNEKQKHINLINTFTIKSEIDISDDYEENEEIDEEKKDFNEIKNKEINNRYDEVTLDNDANNNTKLKISKDGKDIGINIMPTKSLVNMEDTLNDKMERKEEKSINMINKCDSIILESESESIKNSPNKVIKIPLLENNV